MESCLTITQINDFIFCPRSIFFHDFLRDNYSPDSFRETSQIQGLASHKAIDSGTYSTRKNVLQGTMVYSTKYNILGRIDIFDIETGVLTERKYSVTAVYDGFRYQLYLQYIALMEMGYNVKKLILYSAKDNKKYDIAVPSSAEIEEMENLLHSMREYSQENDARPVNLNKCRHCNYREICSCYPEEERL